MNREELQRSESFTVAALLALAGGFLDAYTYLCRGGVFANAETGNIVLMGIHLAQCEWREAAAYFTPVLAFAMGVLASDWIRSHYSHRAGRFHWRHFTLAIEMVVLVLASFIPQGELDSLVNILVSFVCAMQVEAFRKVEGNAFATTMCTGNLRSGTEALYQGIFQKSGKMLRKARCYYSVILYFIVGAALGGVLSGYFPQHAVLGAVAFQAAAFVVMIIWEKQLSK